MLDQNHYINNISKLLISPPRSDSLISNENEKKKKNTSRKKLVNYNGFATKQDWITSNLKNATILDLKLYLILSLIQNYE